MTQAIISKKINKAAVEIRDLIKISKRKLLELEVMLSFSEIKRGRVEMFKNGGELLRKLKCGIERINTVYIVYEKI